MLPQDTKLELHYRHLREGLPSAIIPIEDGGIRHLALQSATLARASGLSAYLKRKRVIG